jgi:hypothetical protein
MVGRLLRNCCEDVDLIHQAQDRVQWYVFITTMMSLQERQNKGVS